MAIEKRFNAYLLKLNFDGVILLSRWPITISTGSILLEDKIVTCFYPFADLFFEYLIDIDTVRYRFITVVKLIKD